MDELETGRSISSNVTHSGDIDSMQNITFTAMRIAVVTCKVKPPSADMVDELQNGLASSGIKVASPIPSAYPNGQLPPLPHSNNTQQPIYKTSFSQQPMENLGLRLPATSDDFARELVQLCNFHGKSHHELMSLLSQVPENLFCVHSNYPSNINPQSNNYQTNPQQYSPPINSQMIGQLPMFPTNIPNGGPNSNKYSHIKTPSPMNAMNTSPTGSTTTMLSQSNSMMAPLSIGSMDNGNGIPMDQSSPTTPFMNYGQL